MSTTIAEIAAETVITAAFAGVENVTIDAAVAQPLKMAAGLQQGFSLDEVNQAAQDGMIFGGALGAGSGVLRAGVSPSLSKAELLMRPPSLRPDLVELGPAARNGERIPCVGEPIDVASGAMLMTATDLTLPATLPLVFQRTHLSSYRGGVCFGPTWISTLDECVQIDGEGVVFAAADGMRLVYAVPEPGVPTLPVTGPRWPLEWDGKPDGVMTVTDPDAGVSRTFTTPSPPDRSAPSTCPSMLGRTATASASTSNAPRTAFLWACVTPVATTSPSTPTAPASPPCAYSTRPPTPTPRTLCARAGPW
ncbi:DUF6531 domain-containing protein [Streptomyces kaempferi]